MPGRFSWLLVAFIGLFVTTAAIAELSDGLAAHSEKPRQMARWLSVIEPAAYSVTLLVAVFTVAESRRTIAAALVLALLAIAAGLVQLLGSEIPYIAPVRDLLTLLFLAFIVVLLCRHLFRCTEVDLDTIAASVCVYLTLGLLWLAAYSTLVDLDPTSFSFPADPEGGLPGLSLSGEKSAHGLYFSFVTLTTLGYGDIVPSSPIARLLAAGEAIVGQIFLTVLVARLVGLHLRLTTRERLVNNDAIEDCDGDDCDEEDSDEETARKDGE